MQKFAEQKIISPEGIETLYLPLDPAYWVHPKRGATSVKLLGVDNPPEEFLRLAEACGWRYLGGKFYPTDPTR